MKIVAVIPAHLASVRFSQKILYKIHNLPMIEHVRRRALLSSKIDDVFVATCDDEIAAVVKGHGGKVIMTNNMHTNGTSRVAEAIENIDCSHVILLQGDEPLILPRYIDLFAEKIFENNLNDAWNATTSLNFVSELDRHSFVKCIVLPNDRIVFCFRRTPCFSNFEIQRDFVKKIQGIIAFRKDFLLQLSALPPGIIEQFESIEQMRIIEHNYYLTSVHLDSSLPSINQPDEVGEVLNILDTCNEQKKLLSKISC